MDQPLIIVYKGSKFKNIKTFLVFIWSYQSIKREVRVAGDVELWGPESIRARMNLEFNSSVLLDNNVIGALLLISSASYQEVSSYHVQLLFTHTCSSM